MTRKQKRLLRNLIILVAALALILGGVKLYQRHKAAKEQADADARAQAGILTEQQAYTALQYWNGSTTPPSRRMRTASGTGATIRPSPWMTPP